MEVVPPSDEPETSLGEDGFGVTTAQEGARVAENYAPGIISLHPGRPEEWAPAYF